MIYDHHIVSKKQKLRQQGKEIRSAITSRRRQAADFSGPSILISVCHRYDLILSYASFGTEFSTWKLNATLAKNKKLILPRIHCQELHLYAVETFFQMKKKFFWHLGAKSFSLSKNFSFRDLIGINTWISL